MRRLGPILTALTLLWTVTAAAQSEPSQGSTIPELAGAEPVTGSMLIDGRLPLPYLDYIIVLSPTHSQKVSLFQNGLVTVTTTIENRKSLKKVLFPSGAIDAYREHLNYESLRRSEKQPLISTPTRLRETIRIYDDEGKSVERTYDPSLYLPSSIEGPRALLQDLTRILIEDNEITSPMLGYEPRTGDKLLDQQMMSWTVLNIVNDHLEVQSDDSPLRAWIKAERLDEQFVSWSRPVQPAR